MRTLQSLIDSEGPEKLRAAMVATPKILARDITRVVIRGQYAMVVFEVQGQRSTDSLQHEAGSWRFR